MPQPSLSGPRASVSKGERHNLINWTKVTASLGCNGVVILEITIFQLTLSAQLSTHLNINCLPYQPFTKVEVTFRVTKI